MDLQEIASGLDSLPDELLADILSRVPFGKAKVAMQKVNRYARFIG